MRMARAVPWGATMLLVLAAVRPGTAEAQRPAQGTAMVSAMVLPSVPRPTMDAVLEAGSWTLEASSAPGVQRPAWNLPLPVVRDSVATVGTAPPRRVRVLAWVGT